RAATVSPLFPYTTLFRSARGSYIMTLVHRLADVDTAAAMRFESNDPAAAQQLDREVKQRLGGSWDMWWLLTPRPGVVWCNCPHIDRKSTRLNSSHDQTSY